MILFIIKIVIIIYLILMIKKVYDMINYKSDANLINLENPTKEKLEIEITNKSPIKINKIESESNYINLEIMNKQKPGYIINDNESLISLEELIKSKNISIIKNKNIIKDFNFNSSFERINNIIDNVFMCGKESYVSLYKGNYISPLYKNYREYLLIKPLIGKIKMYLFNPKHEMDIKGKISKSIKKWGIPIELTKNTLIYIPTEWYYNYELEDETILLQYESDSYSTYIYNYLRKK